MSADNPSEGLIPAKRLRTDLLIILISWGVFGSCWWNAVLGVPYTAYAVRLGATPLMLGFLSSAVVLGVVGQVFSAYLIERTGRRKAIFLATDLIQRPLWILVGALPFLIPGRHGEWRVIALLGLTLTSSFLGNTASPAWVGWMAQVIPDRIRARFLGIRYRLATITGIITALVVGKVLDWDSSYRTFFAIFGLTAVMGTIDIVLFIFMPRRDERPSPQPPSMLGILLIPWSDKRFRRYLYYAASSAACYGIMGQFLTLYFLEGISLGKFYTNLYLYVIPLVVAAALGPMIGRHIGDYGNRPVLLLATVFSAPLPVMFGAAQHDSYVLLVGTGVLAGIVTGVLGITELNLLFAMTPSERRSAYLAAVALTSGLVGAAAPMVGGAIAQALAGWQVTFAGLPVTNLHAVFLAAALLRVAHVTFFVPRLPEPDARPASELVADVLKAPQEAASDALRRLLGR